MLTSLGFTNFHHYKSGTANYPMCLNNAIVSILQDNLDEPVLILEDDIDTNEKTEFTLPPNTDALYVGLSFVGGSLTENHYEGPAQFRPYSEKQVQLRNMLSGHAILYVSRRYKEAIIAALQAYADTNYNTDILFSRLHPKFNVYANRMPTFWQSNRFNVADLEHATKITFAYPHNTIMKF